MALWHEFGWELKDVSGWGVSDTARDLARERATVPYQRVERDDRSFMKFGFSCTFPSAVNAAKMYLRREFEAFDIVLESDNDGLRREFWLSFIDGR